MASGLIDRGENTSNRSGERFDDDQAQSARSADDTNGEHKNDRHQRDERTDANEMKGHGHSTQEQESVTQGVALTGLSKNDKLEHLAEQLTRVLENNDWFALHEELRPSRRVLSDATWAVLEDFVANHSTSAPGGCLVFQSSKDRRAFVRTKSPGASNVVWAYTTNEFSMPQHLAMLQTMPSGIPTLRSNRALKFLRSYHARFETQEESDPTAQDPPHYVGARTNSDVLGNNNKSGRNLSSLASKSTGSNGLAPVAARRKSQARKRAFAEIELTEDGKHTAAALHFSRQEVNRANFVRELRRLESLGKKPWPHQIDGAVPTILGSFPQRGVWVTTEDVEHFGETQATESSIKWWAFWRALDGVSQACSNAETLQQARVADCLVVRMLTPVLGYRWLYVVEASAWSEAFNTCKLASFANECRAQLVHRLRSRWVPATPELAAAPSSSTDATEAVFGHALGTDQVGGALRHEEMILICMCILATHTTTHVWYESAEFLPKQRVSAEMWNCVLGAIDRTGIPIEATAPELEAEGQCLRAVRLVIGHNILVKTRNEVFGTTWIYVGRHGEHGEKVHEGLVGQLLQGQTKAPRHVSGGRPAPELRTVLATHHELVEERCRFDACVVEKVCGELAKTGLALIVVQDPTDAVLHFEREDAALRARRGESSDGSFTVSWELDTGRLTVRALGTVVSPAGVPTRCSSPAAMSQALALLERFALCPGDGFRHPLYAQRCVDVFVDLPAPHRERAVRLGSAQRLVVGAVLDDADEVAVVVECAMDGGSRQAKFRARAADCAYYCARKKTSRFVACEACLKQINARIRRGESRLVKASSERDPGYGHLARAELKLRYDHVVKELAKARRREDRAKDMLNKQRRGNRDNRRVVHGALHSDDGVHDGDAGAGEVLVVENLHSSADPPPSAAMGHSHALR
ncbi:Hypothetical Protein FCC1311_039802 [Hondaea fermentalgiana]|uniref:Uncharacterized protein n=1 Tax=Hondaea fermentalgiana TaxID=2315210 RepID=A0A2R5G9P4_9STRA|nr:Hypothetical Protein FCC1311_039802 [Hondaea fermentalgiana]|eukprot:GBG27757.1 Hypothetical Protein FCC1311_039802 [Hondaea fermentalgiana]